MSRRRSFLYIYSNDSWNWVNILMMREGRELILLLASHFPSLCFEGLSFSGKTFNHCTQSFQFAKLKAKETWKEASLTLPLLHNAFLNKDDEMKVVISLRNHL